MMTKQHELFDQFKDLYVNQSKNMREIGDAHNLSRERVRQILKSGGITEANTRPMREAGALEVIKRYLHEYPNAAMKDIVSNTGYTASFITRLLRQHGIERDRSMIIKNVRSNGRKVLTRSALENMYIDNDLTQNEIAELTGYSQRCITENLRKYKIKKQDN